MGDVIKFHELSKFIKNTLRKYNLNLDGFRSTEFVMDVIKGGIFCPLNYNAKCPDFTPSHESLWHTPQRCWVCKHYKHCDCLKGHPLRSWKDTIKQKVKELWKEWKEWEV